MLGNVAMYTGLSVVAGYLGYKCAQKTFQVGKDFVLRKIGNRVQEELQKIMDKETAENRYEMNPNNKSVCIRFPYCGTMYEIYLPFSRMLSLDMCSRNYYLIGKDGNTRTQLNIKPGIPLQVSAEMLGGSSILVEDLEGELVASYHGDIIPQFYDGSR